MRTLLSTNYMIISLVFFLTSCTTFEPNSVTSRILVINNPETIITTQPKGLNSITTYIEQDNYRSNDINTVRIYNLQDNSVIDLNLLIGWVYLEDTKIVRVDDSNIVVRIDTPFPPTNSDDLRQVAIENSTDINSPKYGPQTIDERSIVIEYENDGYVNYYVRDRDKAILRFRIATNAQSPYLYHNDILMMMVRAEAN